MKIKKDNDKVIGFLKLLNGSNVDLSYDENSGIILMSFEDYISRMSFKEFKKFVKALETYIEYIEHNKQKITFNCVKG